MLGCSFPFGQDDPVESSQTELVELPHEMETGNFESDSQSQAVAAARLARQKARGRPACSAPLFFVKYDMDTCHIQDAPPKLKNGYWILDTQNCHLKEPGQISRVFLKRTEPHGRMEIPFGVQVEVTSIKAWQGVSYAHCQREILLLASFDVH